MQKQPRAKATPVTRWVPLSRATALLFSRWQLLGWSLLLVAVMILLTWLGYRLSVEYLDELSRPLFGSPPDAAGLLGRLQQWAWHAAHWCFTVILRVLAFYLAFLLAYSLCTPGYALLSAAAEKLHGNSIAPRPAGSFWFDIIEGVKIGLLGVLVTAIAFAANFVPVIGQVIVLLLYTGYSTLMFIDFAASRSGWSLRQKVHWLWRNRIPTLRLGLLPALASMIPFLNIFVIALLFPVLTIHATLNFTTIEGQPLIQPPAKRVPHARRD